MANKKITYTVDLRAQADQFQHIIEQSKKALAGLFDGKQVTPRQYEQLSQSLLKMAQTSEEIRKNAEKGFSSSSAFDQVKKQIDGLDNSFSRFLSNLRALNIDPNKFLPDTEEFKNVQKEITKTANKLKELAKGQKISSSRTRVDSQVERDMARLAGQGNISGVKNYAQQLRNTSAKERQKLGSKFGKLAKKNDVSVENLNEVLVSQMATAEKKLAGLRSQRKGSTEEGKTLEKEIDDTRALIEELQKYLNLKEQVKEINEAEKDYTGIAKQVEDLKNQLDQLEVKFKELAGPTQEQAKQNLDNLTNSETQVTQATKEMSNEVEKGAEKYSQLDDQAKNMNGLKSYFNSLVSATAIYMRLRQAVIGAFNDFKEIDSELNAISIVTGKTMKELWGNFGNLNSIAQQYGVTTKNVIEVQKLYYQQGRNAVEVTQLTGETLKFAKISGLDFANATDYMTAALNAYNIAAKDASEITDTYAALSAAAAVDSQEVAVAMSKVASMAAAAGSTFKDTSAYLSKIIEVTREAPETSGTALKTIVARFTEIDKLTEDQAELLDSDFNFNNIEKALKMVGIASKDSAGQLRSFSDIINELGEKWDTLDTNTQHYIATQAAGSRQQSRFLALMSDWSRTQELMSVAEQSAGTGARQLALSMDSIETKLNKLKATWQEFYTKFLSSDMVKGILDLANDLLSTLTSVIGLLDNAGSLVQTLAVILAVVGIKQIISVGQSYGKVFMEAFTKAYTAGRAKNLAKETTEAVAQAQAKGTATGVAEAQAHHAAYKAAEKALDAGDTAEKIASSAAKAVGEAGTQAAMDASTQVLAGSSSVGIFGKLGTLLGGKLAGVMAKVAPVIGPVLIGILVPLFTAIITKAITQGMDKSSKKVAEEVNKQYTEITETINEVKSTTNDYNEALELQRKGILRTAEETENYQKILNNLKATYPELVKVLSDGTLELNSQSDAMANYTKESADALERRFNQIQKQSKDAIANGVVISNTGLKAQSDIQNYASIQKNMNPAYEEIANSGMSYESSKKLLGTFDVNEYKAILKDYKEMQDAGQTIQEKVQADSAEIMLEQSGERMAWNMLPIAGPMIGLWKSSPEQRAKQLEKLQELDKDTGGAFTNYINEQENLIEAWANSFTDLYADATGGKNSEVLKSGIVNKYKFDDEITPAKVREITKQYYQEVNKSNQESFNKYVDQIGTDLVINETATPEQILTMFGLPTTGEIADVLKTGLENVFKTRNDELEQLREKYNNIKNSNYGSDDFTAMFGGYTPAQVKQLITEMDNVGQKYGSSASSAFETAYKKYSDIIGGNSDLLSKFTAVNLTDMSSIADYASLMAVKFKEGSNEYKQFIELVNNSSNILDRSFKPYDEYLTSAKNSLVDLEDFFDSLKKAFEGKLGIEEAFDLITKSGNLLSLNDFQATTDGFLLNSNRIKDVQNALITQKKIALQLELAQYQLAMKQIQNQADQVKELNGINLEEWARLKIKSAQIGLDEKAREKMQQMDDLLSHAENFDVSKAWDYLNLLQNSEIVPQEIAMIDKMNVSWNNAISGINKAIDALKEFIDRLEQLDKYVAIDTFMERLDFEISKYDFTINFSTNVDEVSKATIDKMNTLTEQINANLAKSKFAEQSAQQYRNELMHSRFGGYVSFTEAGDLVENYDKITELSRKLQKQAESVKTDADKEAYDRNKEEYDNLLKFIEAYREERKLMQDSEQKAREYVQQQKELLKTQLENVKTVEDKLLQLMEERDQKAIDSLKERYDYMKKQDQEYLNSVKEAVDKERKIRDNTQDLEDLNKQERKLQLLKMSGGSVTEIQNLEQEIAKSRQELADQQIDNLIEELNDEQKIKEQKMDDEVEYLQAVQDAKLQTMTEYNIELQGIMSKSKEEIIAFWKSLDNEYIIGTQTSRELLNQEMDASITQCKASMETLAYPIIEATDTKITELADSTDLSRQAFENYGNTIANLKGSMVDNINEIRDAYLGQYNIVKELIGAYEKLAGEKEKANNIGNGGGNNTNASNNFTTGLNKSSNGNIKYGYGIRANTNVEPNRHDKGILYDNPKPNASYSLSFGTFSSVPLSIFAYNQNSGTGKAYSINKDNLINAKITGKKSGIYNGATQSLFKIENIIDDMGEKKTGYIWETDLKKFYVFNKNFLTYSIPQFAHGGLVNFTGPAWVDGTKSSPEAFLSAKDTANIASLRDILSKAIPSTKFSASQSTQNDGDVYYQIHINVDELGDGYSIDDLMSEMEDRILNITGKHSVIQIK